MHTVCGIRAATSMQQQACSNIKHAATSSMQPLKHAATKANEN
jgi:hypothetical protein